MILLDEFTDSAEVVAHILVFEWNPSLREVGFCRIARRSSRLAEEDHTFAVHTAMRLSDRPKGGTKRLDFRSYGLTFNRAPAILVMDCWVESSPLLDGHSAEVLDLKADLGRLL